MSFFDFPIGIEIQTISYCNSYCVTCPYGSIKESMGIMNEELFRKIIDEISIRKEKIRIIPYLNAEPFLDSSIIEKIMYINEKCPNAEVELSTNISLVNDVTREQLKKVRIDDFRISFFAFSAETYMKMMPGLNWEVSKNNLDLFVEDYQLRENIKYIQLVMIDYPQVPYEEYKMAQEYCIMHGVNFNKWGYLDRASNVPGLKNNLYYNQKGLGCEQRRESERMHILFDGTVIQCSQDWSRNCVLGDLKSQSIYEVWNSKEYEYFRKSINDKNCISPELCQKCKLMIGNAQEI